jgi:hypothetical protein
MRLRTTHMLPPPYVPPFSPSCATIHLKPVPPLCFPSLSLSPETERTSPLWPASRTTCTWTRCPAVLLLAPAPRACVRLPSRVTRSSPAALHNFPSMLDGAFTSPSFPLLVTAVSSLTFTPLPPPPRPVMAGLLFNPPCCTSRSSPTASRHSPSMIDGTINRSFSSRNGRQ